MISENIDSRGMYKIDSTYRCTNRITKSSIRMQCVKFEVDRRISFGYYVTCDTHSQTHPLINKRTEALLAVRKPWTFCNACEMIHRSLWQNQLHHGVEAKTMTDKNDNTEIRKEFCPNCEAEVPCTHEAELYVCDICGEDFAKYLVSRDCNVSDDSVTRDVTTPEPHIRGGDGSHWEGCEEVHLDCRIAQLENAVRMLAYKILVSPVGYMSIQEYNELVKMVKKVLRSDDFVGDSDHEHDDRIL